MMPTRCQKFESLYQPMSMITLLEDGLSTTVRAPFSTPEDVQRKSMERMIVEAELLVKPICKC